MRSILSLAESPEYFTEPFTKFQALLDLYILGLQKPSTVIAECIKVEVLPKRWKWQKTDVINLLKNLEKSGLITKPYVHDGFVVISPLSPELLLTYKEKKEYPLPFDDEHFEFFWDYWLKYRREKKLSAYKPIGLSAFFDKLLSLSDGDSVTACKILYQSIQNNWQGIFPLNKTQFNEQKYSSLKSEVLRDLQAGGVKYQGI